MPNLWTTQLLSVPRKIADLLKRHKRIELSKAQEPVGMTPTNIDRRSPKLRNQKPQRGAVVNNASTLSLRPCPLRESGLDRSNLGL